MCLFCIAGTQWTLHSTTLTAPLLPLLATPLPACLPFLQQPLHV
jgi:hypothetical protein